MVPGPLLYSHLPALNPIQVQSYSQVIPKFIHIYLYGSDDVCDLCFLFLTPFALVYQLNKDRDYVFPCYLPRTWHAPGAQDIF